MVTCPPVDPVIVTEHVPSDRKQNESMKETDPVLLFDQVTMPVGAYPFTLAVQVMTVEEPATTDLGVQETVVFEVFTVTTKLYHPVVGELAESPQ